MIRPTLAALLLALPVAAPMAQAAETKAQSCAYQAQVVVAIQNARLKRVKERDVAQAIADTNPTWPDSYNNAIPLITPWVYEQKMSVVRKNNLGEAWQELCLQQ